MSTYLDDLNTMRCLDRVRHEVNKMLGGLTTVTDGQLKQLQAAVDTYYRALVKRTGPVYINGTEVKRLVVGLSGPAVVTITPE